LRFQGQGGGRRQGRRSRPLRAGNLLGDAAGAAAPLGRLPAIVMIEKSVLQAISAASVDGNSLTAFRVRVTLVHDG
jgi:hypothetical protein